MIMMSNRQTAAIYIYWLMYIYFWLLILKTQLFRKNINNIYRIIKFGCARC
jgi:hypothetical protein